MALQTSGAISFQDLQDEFGGSHPITMYEYAQYRTSGSGGFGVAISLSNFYGAQASTAFSLTKGNSGTSFYGYRINQYGSISPTTFNSGSIRGIYTYQSKSSYTLFIIFGGNKSQNHFSSFQVNSAVFGSSSAGYAYNSQTNETTWTWATSYHILGTSGTSTVYFQ